MILLQISTFVIVSSLLCLVLPVKVASAIFNKILFAFLCCMYVVIFAFDCTQEEKWKWLMFKVLIFSLNAYRLFPYLSFDICSYVFSCGMLLAYLCIIDIKQIYGCSVSNRQLLTVYSVSSLTYFLVFVLMVFVK